MLNKVLQSNVLNGEVASDRPKMCSQDLQSDVLNRKVVSGS